MKKACGCCEGVEQVTPVSVANRPGLGALVYRAGTHATFFETMRARLSSHSLPVGQARARPLHGLTTRDASDPAVAFLDAWATVADVLTFYQERVANEGYLRTATERRSVLELARLIGYQPRPGVAASVYLAYTLDDGSEATIPAGSRAQSVPGPDELPQTFETAEDTYARAEWNSLRPRLARPQAVLPQELAAGRPVYLKGTSTNLKPNDPLLIDFGANRVALFRVLKVEPDQAADRTRVEAGLWSVAAPTPAPAVRAVAGQSSTAEAITSGARQIDELRRIIERHADAESFGVNANTQTARRVIGHVEDLRRELDSGPSGDRLRELLEAALGPLREEHRLAVEGNFTKLEPWIGGIVSELERVSQSITASAASTVGGAGATGPAVARPLTEDAFAPLAAAGGATPPPRSSPQPALAQLSALLDDLEKPVRVQPSSKRQLGKSLADAFASSSDALPQLLAALRPALAHALYNAWGNVPATGLTPARVYALRARASVFGHNAPLKPITGRDGRVTGHEEWTLFKDAGDEGPTEHFRIGIRFAEDRTGDVGFIRLVTTVAITSPAGVTTTGTATEDFRNHTFTVNVPAPNAETVNVTMTVGSNTLELSLDYRFTARQVSVRAVRNPRGEWTVTADGSDPTSVAVAHVSGGATGTGGQRENTVTIDGDLLGAAGRAPTEQENVVSLDTTYNQVLPGSWAVLERPTPLPGAASALVITQVALVSDGSRADYGVTAKGTQLQLGQRWIAPADDQFRAIRGTNVFVQSELLELAEEPLDPVAEALCGDRIELDRLVSGLEPGRWLIVSGERTDIKPRQPAGGLTGTAPVLKDRTRVNLEIDKRTRVNLEMDKRTAAEHGGEAPLALAGADGGRVGFTDGTPGSAGGAASSTGGDAVPGVRATELIMLSGVEQGYDASIPGDKTHTTLLLARPLAYCYKLDTVRVYGNVARATHGETREEVLGSGDASQAMQSFELKQSPLTYVSAPTPSGVESTLRVRVNQILWRETDSPASPGPTDRAYSTKTDDESVTTVVFGNGHQGARPATGEENVTATYRTGIGRGGNVKAEQITIATSRPPGVREVVNPLPASGGADREGRDEARRNAPLAVMSLDRLVSTRDYEDFARTFAGVGKASAARLSDGRRQVVHLTVAGADDIPIAPDSDLLRNLSEALRKYGDPFQPVQIATRFLKVLFVSARVSVRPDYLWEAVEPRVRAAMLDRFGFDRRDLGQDVVLSEVIGTIQSAEGVAYVDVDALDFVPENVTTETLLQLAANLKLNQRIRVDLAGVDPAAPDPSARIRPAQLALLTPLVPETLNLRELKR